MGQIDDHVIGDASVDTDQGKDGGALKALKDCRKILSKRRTCVRIGLS